MVVWSDTSIMHITEFVDEAKNGTEQTAKNYMNKLIDYVEILNTMPNLGNDFPIKLYNKYKLKQLIYKKHRIVYNIENNDIVILAVIHTRLDIKKAIRSIKKGI